LLPPALRQSRAARNFQGPPSCGQVFWASRCFWSDFRRVIFAIAARTASVRVRGFFADAGPVGFPCLSALASALGMTGSICIGMDRLWSMGCILIGPAWSEGTCFLGISI
jgi:hypothetical protein